MHSVRFVHAADLHLDAAFSGVSAQAGAELAVELHRATFKALEHLEALCLAERPDFLLLAGDLYNEEDGSLAAQLKVRDLCARLDAANIPVFIAHGNHDPLCSRMKSLRWPANVTVFGEIAQCVPVRRDGRLVAVVHGISHATGAERGNLAKQFARTDEISLPDGSRADARGVAQVGVLHCTLDDPTERYAPCTVADLEETGLDYWALGHVHQQRVTGSRGHIAYSGSAQGLHVNETGAHGCHLVTLSGADVAGRAFHPLGPVVWEHIDLDVAGLDDAAHLVDIHDAALERLLVAASVRAEENPRQNLCIARLTFTGRGEADALLRAPGARDELLASLREAGLAARHRAWVKDIIVASRPVADLEHLRRERDDLLGESLRVADELRTDPDALAGAAAELLALLRKNPALSGLLNDFTPEELQALLDDAEIHCLDLLDAHAPEAD